jgi:hypothetical protein
MNERVYGILGRALSLFRLRLHAFIFMSNHKHYVARVADAEQACGFVGYMNRNTAIAAQRLTGWNDDVWSHTSMIPILDDDAAMARLRYVLSNGVKEGLVESPLHWPGPTGVHALLEERPIQAAWRPMRQKHPLPTDPVYPIEVAPLPSLMNHPLLVRRQLLEELIHGIEEDGRRRRDGRPVLGVAALRAQDPTEETEWVNQHDVPLAFSSRTDLLDRFLEQRAAFIDQFRRAARARRETMPATEFPLPP